MQTNNAISLQKSRGLGTALLAVLVILILTLAPTPANLQAAVDVQPGLLTIAAEQPETPVRVIVQKSDTEADVAGLITRLGGTVLNNLHIINAIVAEMEAKTAVNLARDASVNWVSLDGAVDSARKPPDPEPEALPESFYLDTLNVRPVWDMGYQGEGITVAVIDSGVSRVKDFQVDPYIAQPDTRVWEQLVFSDGPVATSGDVHGHGTHVAGIIASSGYDSGELYKGIAPAANLLSLRISDDTGKSYESDSVAAMQWVLDNKDLYNIRVVNLSLNSATPSSYHVSPMDAAAEILWFNGIVVVVSAGNSSGIDAFDTINSAPANDPFVITVGAMDEKSTSRRDDDSAAVFSAWGTTNDGYAKPEIYAPGTDIISNLGFGSEWKVFYPERVVDSEYFRASGTSMSAPMVSGAVALLLNAEPNLTPDQVKYRLIDTAEWLSGCWYLDVYAAVTGASVESANTGIEASQLLWTGDDPIAWDSVNWGSVNWGSVNWGSVNWGSVNWGSVNWGSVFWDE